MTQLQKEATTKADNTYWLMNYNEQLKEKDRYQTVYFFMVIDVYCKLVFFKAILFLQNHNQSAITIITCKKGSKNPGAASDKLLQGGELLE